eukprot:4308273-Pyramimonas_sp.AAC.1
MFVQEVIFIAGSAPSEELQNPQLCPNIIIWDFNAANQRDRCALTILNRNRPGLLRLQGREPMRLFWRPDNPKSHQSTTPGSSTIRTLDVAASL